MGNQTYQNSPCPSATMASRVCSHHGHLRRMPRANPATVAAVVKHIHYTGAKNLRERHREKESPLSLRKSRAPTVLRILNTQRTPVLVPSDAELKDVAPSTTPFFTQRSFTSVHPKKQLCRLSLSSPHHSFYTACTTTGTEDPGTILLQVVPLRVIGADGLAVTTFAMLDSDSEITLVYPSLVSSLRLSGQPDRLVFSTVNNQEKRKGRSCSGIPYRWATSAASTERSVVWKRTQHSITPPRYHQRQGKTATSSGRSIPRGRTTEGIADHRNQRSRGVYPLGSSQATL